ncbi:hypothetical protein LCGC14_2762360 [marine sediment metagenome]|uniref:Uncharacterized protein n=1 Tax=marine sediment metagenome TaxID=412755 RepID=A0A0F8YYP4_9ZZZZ
MNKIIGITYIPFYVLGVLITLLYDRKTTCDDFKSTIIELYNGRI